MKCKECGQPEGCDHSYGFICEVKEDLAAAKKRIAALESIVNRLDGCDCDACIQSEIELINEKDQSCDTK